MSLNARAIALQGVGFTPLLVAVQGVSQAYAVQELPLAGGIRLRRNASTPNVLKPVEVSFSVLMPDVGSLAARPALVRVPIVTPPTVQVPAAERPAEITQPVTQPVSTPSVNAQISARSNIALPATAVSVGAPSCRVHAEFSVSRPTSGASTRTRIGIVNSYGFAFPPKTVRNLTDAQMIALLEFM